MRTSRSQGYALISALAFMAIVMISVAIVVAYGYYNRGLAVDLTKTTQAQYAAEAGLEQSTEDLWNDMLVPYPSSIRTLGFYRGKLNFLLAAGATYAFPTGTLDDGSTYNVTVKREDRANSTILSLTSTGTSPSNGALRIINQTLTVAPAKFTGLDFAMLSNNINCTFCHTRVTSMEAAYGSTGANQTNRVKVGTLQSLEMRVANAANQYDAVDTLIGGTVYTRGKVLNQQQDAFDVSSTDDLRFNKIDSAGKVTYDGSKSLQNNVVRGQKNDCSVATNCQTSNQNFYSNYPDAAGIDGALPKAFPLPVPDEDNDKYISKAEWANAIKTEYEQNASTYGSLTAISGGQAALGAPGAVAYRQTSVTEMGTSRSIANGTWKQVAGTVSTGVDAQRGIPGNLYLSGKVRVDGTVYVDGDVVIGKDFQVSGKGKLVARGNVYVSGDIQYDCTTAASPNKTCDYGNLADPDLPSFGLSAVGNVMVGDYSSSQYALRPSLLDKNDNIPPFVTAYKNKIAVPFVVAEVANFNKLEYEKALKDASYVPRFYKMRDEDPIIVYTGTGENFSGYQGTDVTYLGCDAATKDAVGKCSTSSSDNNIMSRARVVSMEPTGDWISESDVKQTWIDNIETPSRPQVNSLARPGTKISKPLQIDASLYSANATFALARGCSNVSCGSGLRSNIDGRITMNGSLISADLGVLSAGSGGKTSSWINGQRDTGLDIHYDSRSAGLFKLDYGDNVMMVKGDYQLVGKEAP